jgi:hypothetical protein
LRGRETVANRRPSRGLAQQNPRPITAKLYLRRRNLYQRALPSTLVKEREAAEEVPGAWELDLSDAGAALRQRRLPHLTWARDLLERARAERHFNVPYLAIVPQLRPLNGHPRYETLVRELGLQGVRRRP